MFFIEMIDHEEFGLPVEQLFHRRVDVFGEAFLFYLAAEIQKRMAQFFELRSIVRGRFKKFFVERGKEAEIVQ